MSLREFHKLFIQKDLQVQFILTLVSSIGSFQTCKTNSIDNICMLNVLDRDTHTHTHAHTHTHTHPNTNRFLCIYSEYFCHFSTFDQLYKHFK